MSLTSMSPRGKGGGGTSSDDVSFGNSGEKLTSHEFPQEYM